jgi:hypothetical protein
MVDETPDVARTQRQLRWVGWMLAAIAGGWAIVGAALIAWSIKHPLGVVLAAVLVGNVLIWLLLANALHRLLMRSFRREVALLGLLRTRRAANG